MSSKGRLPVAGEIERGGKGEVRAQAAARRAKGVLALGRVIHYGREVSFVVGVGFDVRAR